jgi:hypothetical protein
MEKLVVVLLVKKLLLSLFIFMPLISYCQIDTNINEIKYDTICYEPISVTDTLFNLQSKINQLNKQNYLLKDGIIKFKQQTYKGQNNLLKGMILTTAGVVTLYINKGELNMGWFIVIGGLTLDIQGVSDMYNAYKHLNH